MENLRDSCENYLKEQNVLKFIRLVKLVFHLDGENCKYNDFAFALHRYEVQEINRADLETLIKEIFEGHEFLFSRFKNFLPWVDQQETLSDLEFKNQFYNYFMNKVKSRFAENRNVYESFLMILDEYSRVENNDIEINIGKVYEKIINLFLGHNDLIFGLEFILNDIEDKAQEHLEKVHGKVQNHLDEIQIFRAKLMEANDRLERVFEFLNSITANGPVSINDKFTEEDLTYFGQLFGDSMDELKKRLEDDPRSVLAIILTRLKDGIILMLQSFKLEL